MSPAINEHLHDLRSFKAGLSVEAYKKLFPHVKMIKLASNENPLGMSPMCQQVTKSQLDLCHYYPDTSSQNLLTTLADFYQIEENQLVTGNGSEDILTQAAYAFVDRNQSIMVSQYAFPTYKLIAKKIGAQLKVVATEEWGHDLTAILNNIDNNTKLIFIDNPRNPTGSVLTQQHLEKFLQKVPRDILVVLDEAYYEYVDTIDKANGMLFSSKFENVLTTRTFSKIYGLAGMRIGYGIANPQIINAINKIQVSFATNRLAQYMAIEALKDRVHIRKSIQFNNLGKKQLTKQLTELDIPFLPTHGNFLTIQLSQNTEPVCSELLSHGIVLRPLNSFGLPNSIRITIGSLQDNNYVVNCLKHLITKIKI